MSRADSEAGSLEPAARDLARGTNRGKPQSRTRLDAFDGLRASMLMLFLVLHSSLSYTVMPLGDLWPFKDQATHPGFDLLVALLHSFRLPILFVMAGFFAAMLLLERGSRSFIDNRLRRIGVPLVAAWPVIALTVIAAYPFAEHGVSIESMHFAIQALFRRESLGYLQWFHLWFLFDLLAYYTMALLIFRLVRLLPDAARQGTLRAVGLLLESAWAPVALALTTTVSLMAMHSGVLETPGSFRRPLATLIADGVFVIFGWCLYLHRDVIPRIQARTWRYAIVGTLLFALHFLCLVRLRAGEVAYRLPAGLALSGSMWFLVLGISGLFVRYYRRPHRVGRYLSDASYWCYLIHLPFAVWTPLFLADLRLPAVAKFAIVLSVTTGACLLSYDLLVRRTWLGALLNGRRFPRLGNLAVGAVMLDRPTGGQR